MRTFIAIDLPDAARIELSKLIARLNREAAADVKWVEIENLHLTLKFIGHAAEPQIGEIKNILEKLTAAKKPFRVRLAGLGAFPNTRRPRVIWAGVEEGRKPLEGVLPAPVDPGGRDVNTRSASSRHLCKIRRRLSLILRTL